MRAWLPRRTGRPGRKVSARSSRLDAFQRARKSRVILLIHRQETVSFLGVPLARFMDIEDSEALLRAIRLTPTEMPNRRAGSCWPPSRS